jgi:hypothetical protein
MPAARSSLTDPAIGQLITKMQAAAGDRARLGPVLAAAPDSAGPPRSPSPASGDLGPGSNARC